MADSTLVGFDVAAGEKVLTALEHAGIHVAVALWAKTNDYDEPRLFLASPGFDSVSKLEAHARVASAVEPEFTWSAPNVVIVRTTDPFAATLRSLFAGSGSVDGMRLGSQTFGGRYVDDAYVYLIR